MGSAALDTRFIEDVSPSPEGAAPAEELRRQVAERLAAHRSRRSRRSLSQPVEAKGPASIDPRVAEIAAAVAERYARSQSYRAYLEAEAERAVQRARAEAEVAALNAEAVEQAQRQLLERLDRESDKQSLKRQAQAEAPTELPEAAEVPKRLVLAADDSEGPSPKTANPRSQRRSAARESVAATGEAAPAEVVGLTVRLSSPGAAARRAPEAEAGVSPGQRRGEEADDPEARALDAEIAFRRAPVFEEPAGPPVPLPANLIEFPRQLVAPRKARPRYAEGPLREDGAPEPGEAQLRIFEVDPAQISTTPETATEEIPQWTSLWLDAPSPEVAAVAEGGPASVAEAALEEAALPVRRVLARPQTAPAGRRLKAAVVDAAWVGLGFAGFCGAFAGVATRGSFAGLTGAGVGWLAAGLGVVLGSLALLYQGLFLWLGTATPGMRSARIALCTFEDDDPARAALRRRVLALLVSACPLGIGLAWALVDEDGLTWHDRMSGMYPRCYEPE